MQLYNISKGKRIEATVSRHRCSWEKIVSTLSKHKVGESKEDNGYFVGGTFNGNYRNKENVHTRSLLTFDVDTYSGNVDDVLFDMDMGFGDLSYVVYSTWSSEKESPRFRLVFPLDKEIGPDAYVSLCHVFAGRHKEFSFDKSGFKAEGAMFMPSCPADKLEEKFVLTNDGKAINVDDYVDSDDWGDDSGDDSGDDLEELVLAQPLDLSDEDVESYLRSYPASDLSYEEWSQVGVALHHQYQGSEIGLAVWTAWCAVDVARFKPLELPSKWQSFARRSSSVRKNPLTFATIIKRIGDREAVAVLGIYEELREVVVAGGFGEEQYEELRRKLIKIPLGSIPETKRQMLAHEVYEKWGKSVGLTKTAIKKELMPKKKIAHGVTDVSSGSNGDGSNGDGSNGDGSNGVSLNDTDAPAWVREWVYVETECRFANMRLNYSIARDAFNAKFDRMDECVIAEVRASELALNTYHIPCVVDRMYWPMAGVVYEYEGKRMLNCYVSSGEMAQYDTSSGKRLGGWIGDDGGIDADGMSVVELFLKHVELTLSNKREQGILLDWMTHVIRYPGERVNWALLLQGTQGTGKSYYANVMQWILGANVKILDPAALHNRFTGWAHGSVLNVVEEIRIAGDNSWQIVDRMKSYIANDTIQIEEKGRDRRTVPNFTSYLMLTNHKDAIPLSDEDRRYCILYGDIQSKEDLHNKLGGEEGAEQYFSRLFDESRRRADALCAFFMSREISGLFKHKGRAPQTDAREKMINYSKSDNVESVVDAISKFQCNLINDAIVDITLLKYKIEMEFEVDKFALPATNALKKIMLELGYEKCGIRLNAKGGKKHTLWYKYPLSEAEAVGRFKAYHEDGIEIPF